MEGAVSERFQAQASAQKDAAGGGDRDGPSREAPAQSEAVRIEGTMLPKDLYGANKLAGKEKPSNVLWAVGVFSALFFVACVASVASGEFGPWFPAPLFLAVALGIGGRALYSVRCVNRCWRQGRGVFRRQHVEITEEGIRQQMDDRWTAYRWSAFSKYAASRRVLILHFDPPDGWFLHTMRGYLIVPRQFFPSDAEWDRFVELVRSKLPRKYRDRTVGLERGA
jgi:hypothetical protein